MRFAPWKYSPRLGAILWCLCLQFFLAEQIVRYEWTTPYSWAGNYISDLGAIYCTNRPVDSDHFICSPWHSVMNASFILQGLLIAGGAVLIGSRFTDRRTVKVSLLLLVGSGVGVSVVGLAPEDLNTYFHVGGAALHFLAGNLGMILLGVAVLRDRRLPRSIGILAITAGTMGLSALLLLATDRTGAFDRGGIERMVAYPLPLCLATIGWHFCQHQRREITERFSKTSFF